MIRMILDIGAVLIPIVTIGLAIENYILKMQLKKLKGRINESKKKDL